MTITVREFIDYCKTNVPRPNVIFEIGAREGNDSALLKAQYPDAEVYAFEAYNEEYDLHKNNRNLDNIHYHNIAIWSEDTRKTFYKKGTNVNYGSISSFRDRGESYGLDTEEYETISVSSFCASSKIDKIDIVKIDAEGCSYEVLLGFGDLLDTVKVLHIETEQEEHFKGQHLEKEVFELLESRGFSLHKHSRCCYTQHDSIWTKL